MDVTLPEAAWRRRDGLDELAAILGAASDETRFVGGAVRDTLLGIAVSDIDLATRLRPEQVVARLDDAGIRAVPTGIAHGTVTALIASGPIEVTTLRRDVATDGRHAVIAYTDDWRADAGRRDFTMNALYADPLTGRISDFFGGLDDLAARRVRFIGDPLQRINEDHLRILRFFRFHARFGDTIDPNGLDACVTRANDLMALSRERIAAELLKLLVAPNAVAVVALMVDRGILRPVLPEIDAAGADRLRDLATREARAAIGPDAIRRLAVLIGRDDGDAVGGRLRLSKVDRKRLAAAARGPGDEGPRALAYRVGIEAAIDRLLVAGIDPSALRDFDAPAFPITGGALVARGLRKGPAVAATLHAIESQWILEGFPDADRVESIADLAVAQALRIASIDQASEADNGRA